MASSIMNNLNPANRSLGLNFGETKLLVNLLTGGKAASSGVKFANFYLVIDGSRASADTNIYNCYRDFLANLRGRFATGKGGDSAFKLLPDGSFFNAYPSIGDTFKFIEESINVSNANSSRP